ncbi:MAG TPA: DUF559 domain-containing protein [Allosphingosinicella sp.]|jgi:very-short-patch-repair endonuclease
MGVVRRTISKHAGALRQNATKAEQLLWFELRARRLGGHKLRRQWSLHPYVVDFCCLEQRLIVEVDGGQHTPEADAARNTALKAQGFRILRFWNNDVLSNLDGVLTVILQAVGGPLPSEDPHPSPLPQAGEGA